MGKYILSIDQGTTSSRAFVYNEKFEVIGKGQQTFPQHYPKAGWVEHDLEEIWASVEGSIRQSIADVSDSKFSANKIVAIGITNQRETFGLWNRKTGKAVGPAIVWQCRRSAKICERLRKSKAAQKVAKDAGLVLDPYFSGSKLTWLFENNAKIKAQAKSGNLAFGNIDTFLIWRLSGGAAHVTDTTNASRTLLMDLKKLKWNQAALKVFKVPAAILPEIKDSDARFAETKGLKFLPNGIPVHGVLGDQHAALLGQGCLKDGETKVTYGTGAFLVMNTGKVLKKSKRALSTVAWTLKGKTSYALEGSVFVAGAAVQWLRDDLKMIQNSSEIEGLAAEVHDSDGVFFVPALAGLGSPYWAPEAKGMIGGITRGSTRAHIARACLDGIASSVAEVVEVLREDSKLKLRSLSVDGGACANNILMQTQSNLLQARVKRPVDVETTVRGAAYAAAIGVGMIKLKDIAAAHKVEREFTPEWSGKKSKEFMAVWKRRIKGLLAGAY